MPQVQAALKVNVLFIIGIILVPILDWVLRNTRWGLIVRTIGDSDDTARVRIPDQPRADSVHRNWGPLAGVGGSFLSLYYPGGWNEGHVVVGPHGCWIVSSRAGSPGGVFTPRCFSAVPAPLDRRCNRSASLRLLSFQCSSYVLTLGIMVITCSPRTMLAGAPHELSVSK